MNDKKLRKVSCDPICGFMIQSHKEDEVLDFVKTHAKNTHNMNMTKEDIMKRMQYV